MTANDAPRPAEPARTAPSADEIFGSSEPVQRAADLARDGVFDDGEVEEFLADLYAMRRSDVV